MSGRLHNIGLYELLKQFGKQVKLVVSTGQTVDVETGVITKAVTEIGVRVVMLPVDYKFDHKWENHFQRFRYGGYFSKDVVTIIIPYHRYGIFGIPTTLKLSNKDRVVYNGAEYKINEFSDFIEVGLIVTIRGANEPS